MVLVDPRRQNLVPPLAAWVGVVVPGPLAEPATRVGGPGTILGDLFSEAPSADIWAVPDLFLLPASVTTTYISVIVHMYSKLSSTNS